MFIEQILVVAKDDVAKFCDGSALGPIRTPLNRIQAHKSPLRSRWPKWFAAKSSKRDW